MKKFYILILLLISKALVSNNPLPEKPLYVVVTSFNNEPWVKKNLDSIFSQHYSNYHVVYMDDCSSDKTVQVVKEYVKNHNLEDKITIITNAVREWKLINLYRVYHAAQDWEIIVQVDGDDWLANPRVFQNVNNAFSQHNAWITYGGYQRAKTRVLEDGEVEQKLIGFMEPEKLTSKHIFLQNSFRLGDWNYPHLHAFYAWLFKLIKLEDFITTKVPKFEGKLFPFANDQAMVYPMFEMASRKHIYNFKELVYIGSMPEKRAEDKLVNWTPTVEACQREVKAGHIYDRLSNPVLRNLDEYKKKKVTLFVFCFDDRVQVIDHIGSIRANVNGYTDICFIGKEKTSEMQEVINYLKYIDNNINYFDISSKQEREDFENYIQALKNDYIMLCDTAHPFKNKVDLRKSIYLLEKTFAYAFYFDFDLNKHSEPIHPLRVEGHTYTWKFIFGKGIWKNINNTHGTLYRKDDLRFLIRQLYNKGFEGLNAWKNEPVNVKKIGLFYQQN